MPKSWPSNFLPLGVRICHRMQRRGIGCKYEHRNLLGTRDHRGLRTMSSVFENYTSLSAARTCHRVHRIAIGCKCLSLCVKTCHRLHSGCKKEHADLLGTREHGRLGTRPSFFRMHFPIRCKDLSSGAKTCQRVQRHGIGCKYEHRDL